MEVLDLVKTIRAAAKDPTVVALYGIFGHGYEFSSGGWGHVDEVRDALLAFRASPAAIDAGDDVGGSTPRTKPLYAFAVSCNVCNLLIVSPRSDPFLQCRTLLATPLTLATRSTTWPRRSHTFIYRTKGKLICLDCTR